MAQLVTTAVIRMHDQLTAPLQAMASKVAGYGQRLNSSLRNVGAGVGGALGGGKVIGSAMSGMLMHKEYEYDKQLTRFKAITEISDDEMKNLDAVMTRIGDKTSAKRTDILEGALKWKEAGASLDDYTKSLEDYAKISRITGTSIAETALESRGMMLAYGEDVSSQEAVRKNEEFVLVASKNIKGGLSALNEIFKSAAPIGAKLQIAKEDLAALGSVGVAEGFQPGEIGRALKTVPMRLVAPSQDALMSMRFAGIDMEKLYNIDRAKVQDTSGLVSGLRSMGVPIGDNLAASIQRQMVNADWSQGMGPLQDKISKNIGDAMGMKQGDAKNRGKINKAVGLFFQTAAKGLNLEELFKSKDLALSILTPIFGKEHAAKIMAIMNQGGLFAKIRDQIKKEAPGAIDRKSKIAFQGFSFELDNMTTAVDNFWKSFGAAGIKSDAAYAFRGIGDVFKAARDINPAIFQSAGRAATVLAAAGAGSALLGAAFKPLLAGGAAFTALGGMDTLYGNDILDARDKPQKTLFAGNSDFMRTVEAATGMGRDLSAAFTDAATGIGKFGGAMREAFGGNKEFNTAAEMLRMLALAISGVGTAFTGLGKGINDAGELGAWVVGKMSGRGGKDIKDMKPEDSGFLSWLGNRISAGEGSFMAGGLPNDNAALAKGMQAQRGDGTVMTLADVLQRIDGERATGQADIANTLKGTLQTNSPDVVSAIERLGGIMSSLPLTGPAGRTSGTASAPNNATPNPQVYGGK
jgi:hypothetical protein